MPRQRVQAVDTHVVVDQPELGQLGVCVKVIETGIVARHHTVRITPILRHFRFHWQGKRHARVCDNVGAGKSKSKGCGGSG